MSRFEEFAKRFHGVKEGVQEIAEQNLEKANSAYVSGMTALKEIMQELDYARQQRLRAPQTVAEIEAWSMYIARLESLLKSQQEKIALLGENVEEKRADVKEAYIDQKKWSQIVDQHVKKKAQAETFGRDQEADESAVIRHGRGI